MIPEIDQKTHGPWLDDASPEELRRIVDALYRVYGLLARVTDLSSLLEAIMEESKAVASAEACSLLLYDPSSKELYFEVALSDQGDQEALKSGLRLKLGDGIAGTTAQTLESINVANAAEDPRLNRTGGQLAGFETHTLLAVPLVDNEELVGVLEVLNKTNGEAFSEFDQRIMEMFSSQAASAITRARLIQDNLDAERLAAVGQAVAGLSHYTKNIITGMSGGMDLMEMGIDAADPSLLEKSWPILKRSIARMSHVVEDMLAFSKEREPMLEPCDPRKLVEEAVETFSGLATKRNINLEVDLDSLSPDCSIRVDERSIHRSLLNLLTNAADAAKEPDGRVRIRASLNDQGDMEFEVSDNGTGIPGADREKIFDAFFSTKGGKGTGLGLAVTRKIVMEHGGTVEVGDSDLGGASIKLCFPIGE